MPHDACRNRGALPQQALAVVPVVKTVPWDATNFASPHFTYSGKVITLKGTSNVQGANFHYDWNPGDGVCTHRCGDQFVRGAMRPHLCGGSGERHG